MRRDSPSARSSSTWRPLPRGVAATACSRCAAARWGSPSGPDQSAAISHSSGTRSRLFDLRQQRFEDLHAFPRPAEIPLQTIELAQDLLVRRSDTPQRLELGQPRARGPRDRARARARVRNAASAGARDRPRARARRRARAGAPRRAPPGGGLRRSAPARSRQREARCAAAPATATPPRATRRSQAIAAPRSSRSRRGPASAASASCSRTSSSSGQRPRRSSSASRSLRAPRERRVEDQRLAQVALRILRAARSDPARPLQQSARAQGGRRSVRERAVQQLEQQLARVVPFGELEREALGFCMAGRDLEHATQMWQRVGRASERAGEQASQLDARGCLARRGRARELDFEQARERLVLPRASVQLAQGGLGFAVSGAVREHLAVGLGRLGLALARAQGSGPAQTPTAALPGVGARRGCALAQLDQVVGVAGAFVEVGERFGDGGLRPELGERRLEAGDRAVGIAQASGPQAGDAQAKRSAPRRPFAARIAGQAVERFEPRFEQGDHGVRVALALPVRDQIVGSRRVVAVELEHARPVPAHPLRRVRCAREQRRSAAAQSDFAGALGPGCELTFERAQQLAAAAGSVVEVGERTPGLGALGREPRGRLEVVDGGVGVRESVAAESTEPLVQRGSIAIGGVGERGLEQRAQRSGVARAFEQRGEPLAQLVAQRGLGIARERLFERQPRACPGRPEAAPAARHARARARRGPAGRIRTPRARRAVRRDRPRRQRRAAPPRGRREPRAIRRVAPGSPGRPRRPRRSARGDRGGSGRGADRAAALRGCHGGGRGALRAGARRSRRAARPARGAARAAPGRRRGRPHRRTSCASASIAPDDVADALREQARERVEARGALLRGRGLDEPAARAHEILDPADPLELLRERCQRLEIARIRLERGFETAEAVGLATLLGVVTRQPTAIRSARLRAAAAAPGARGNRRALCRGPAPRAGVRRHRAAPGSRERSRSSAAPRRARPRAGPTDSKLSTSSRASSARRNGSFVTAASLALIRNNASESPRSAASRRRPRCAASARGSSASAASYARAACAGCAKRSASRSPSAQAKPARCASGPRTAACSSSARRESQASALRCRRSSAVATPGARGSAAKARV